MNILGINIRPLSYEEMFSVFDRWLANKDSRSYSLAVINVHICVSALMDKRLREIYNSVDLAGSDGMPFLLWSRAFYKKNSDRFYAPDLMLQISSRAKDKRYTFYLYGGYPGAPDKIEEYLKKRFEGIRVVGKYSPPFRELSTEEDAAICEEINRVGPDFLWIGLGSPKQDIWIHEHRKKLRGCIIVPSGATFDFFSERIRQAPLWIRNSGFEWLFRLTQDFRRLWIRYSVYNFIFLIVFFLQQIRVISFDSEGYLLIFRRRSRFGNQKRDIIENA